MSFVSLMLPPGIQRNATPYDTPGRWWDMNLVRWQSGTLRPIGGWQRTTNTAFNKNGTVNPGRIVYSWRDNDDNDFSLIGTDEKLYVENSGSYTDVSPTALVPLSSVSTAPGYGTKEYGQYDYGNARPGTTTLFAPVGFWSMSNWGENVIFTASTDGKLYQYVSNSPTAKPTAISGAPTGNTSVIVTAERHVMAIGASSAGAGANYRRIAWSSREDNADWDFTDVTNTAGFIDLESKGPLVRGVNVREGVLVFSSGDCYLARYVGLPYIYAVDRLGDTTLLCPMAVAAYNGKAAWMGKNGFWRYEGGILAPLACPILNDVFVNIDKTYGPRKAHAVHNGTFPEIWFFYPTEGNSECNRVVVWNYMEDWWSWSDISRTAAASGELNKPYMAGPDGHLYRHEDGWTDAGAHRQVFAETGILPVGGADRGIIINQVLPSNGYGYNSIKVEFKSRQTPEGTERSFGPYTSRPDGYMDTRVNGRDLRMRVEATSSGEWSVGTFRLNVQPGAGR